MKLTYLLLAVNLFISAYFPGKNHTAKSPTFMSPQIKNGDEWIFDKIAGRVLKFKNGKAYNTELYNLSYIGQITNGSNAPFLIFSGRDCDECDANTSIYIHSPANGHLNVQNGENSYTFPGTEKDYENNKPVFKSRVFYGQVLPGVKGVIWYQEQLMENNSWQKSTFLVNLDGGVKKETTSKGVEKLKLTLQLLAQGSCKEIKGVDYTSEP